jgi:hypothetical protein
MILVGRRRSDSGYALLPVIGFGTALMLTVGAVSAYALQGMDSAGRGQGFQAAVQAAQAGVDDFIARVNQPGGYTPDPATWRTVPGSVDGSGQACGNIAAAAPANCPQFRQSAHTTATGIVVTSVGRSRGVERAVQVTLKKRAFTDYLYFSELETADPADRLIYNGLLAPSPGSLPQACRVNAHAAERPASCVEPLFRTGDSLTGGRVHTNDVFQLAGSPDLGDFVTTAWPQCGQAPPARACYRQATGAAPAGLADAMIYDPDFTLATIANLETRAGQTNSGRKGCVYTGPTRIRYNDNGTMTVWSPLTPSDPPGTPANQRCGGSASEVAGAVTALLNLLCLPIVGCPGSIVSLVLGQLTAMAGNTVAVPSENVLYVKRGTPPGGVLGSVVCALGKTLGLSSGSLQPNLGATLNEQCAAGSFMVSGELDGRVTMGAQDNILIVNDLIYDDGVDGDDMLGLVAGGSVEVANPLLSTADLLSNPFGFLGGVLSYLTGNFTRRVDASILALNGRFGVQLSQVVPTLGITGQPKLEVNGSIAQKYAGFTGGRFQANVLDLVNLNLPLNVGFLKDYSYDERLRTQAPPGFPQPTSVVYDPQSFAEVDVPA